MRKNLVKYLAILTLLLPGCFGATTAEQHYYTMDLPHETAPKRSAHSAELLLHEVEMSPVYNRPQIVYRISPQELQFFYQNNWADRPSRMLGQLLLQAMMNSGIFRSVVERLGDKPPEYVMDTTVDAIEELQGGDKWFAHLAMTMRVARFGDNRAIWQYTFDERRPLTEQNLGLVVRAMSEMLHEQLQIALPQIDAAISGKMLPPVPKSVEMPEAVTPGTGPPQATQKSGTETFDGTNGARINWRHEAQYQSDATQIPAGHGAIFLPSLSQKPDREPPVTVFDDNTRVATGTMGRRIPVPPGTYTVDFGSGPVAQHVQREVQVTEGETTVVRPDWATLDVTVVDVNFVPFLGTYELIRMEDHEYLGVGYGVNEELGQETQVWVVQPGLLKVVQSGSTYRARTNFSTVRLLPGMAVPFTLVQDTLTRDFLGAGVSEPEKVRNADNHWSLRSSVGGSALIANRTDGFSSAPAGTSVSIDVFTDNWLQWKQNKHLWTTRFEIEEGQALTPIIGADNKPGNVLDGRLQSIKDRLYFNSVYIYQYLPWLGPYVRVGGETTLFNHYAYFAKPTSVTVQDEKGVITETHTGPDGAGETQFQLVGSLTPIQLKQGMGANFRVLHNTLIDMDLRTGLGSRQYLSRGQLVAADDASTPAFELRRVPDTVLTGIEVSGLSQIRLSRYLQASTEFDMLLPFEGLAATQFTWRNTVSLRLSSFAAVTYTLNLLRQPNVSPDQPLALEQGLQLRFFWSPI